MAAHPPIGFGQVLDGRPRRIAAAVVNKNDLSIVPLAVEHRGDLPMEFGEARRFVDERNDERDHDGVVGW